MFQTTTTHNNIPISPFLSHIFSPKNSENCSYDAAGDELRKLRRRKQTNKQTRGKKNTVPDIFCDYLTLLFQRQVEQLIERRHGYENYSKQGKTDWKPAPILLPLFTRAPPLSSARSNKQRTTQASETKREKLRKRGERHKTIRRVDCAALLHKQLSFYWRNFAKKWN